MLLIDYENREIEKYYLLISENINFFFILWLEIKHKW